MARFVFYFNIQDWIIGQKILKLSKTLRLKVFLGWYLIWCCPKNIGTTFPIASLGPGSVKPNGYWISFYQLRARLLEPNRFGWGAGSTVLCHWWVAVKTSRSIA